ncbi:serine/arginine-rich splicing factor 11-like isoform X1 [Simochromis diagramma]|uniref:Serine/arginine-rich splicing factor 11-like n=2 Tax=Pseudocrenilabrinae TaxID=318546 RepID=A0A3Q2V571_HAPBU|nr:serine/arginine-rich splicing factor 11 isoform X1 [Haplochromis burtoni]XP_039876722.1 serine/arginine-rich splicing factor 11-like isoform X1 [Simochromis diagramma]
MSYTTKVVQVTNVSPSTTSEQMRTLFGFLGTIEELKLFPPDDSPMPVTSRVCFVKFQEPESVGVSQHLTNTVFVDRALIVVPFAEGSIPDEAKALSLLAPANAVAGILPGGGLLPMPNPIPNPPLANPFGAPNIDAMAAFGFPGAGMNPQAADQLLKLMTDPKLNPLAAGINLNAGLKADAANKEIEEAMKRVREAQSLISAAIEPGHKETKKKRSRSRSRSRRRRSRSRSRHRRTRSRSRRRSRSRSRRRSKSPRKRHTHSRDRGRRSRSRSRERKKEDAGRRKSKTPPKSYSTARRSRSVSRRRRKSRSASRSPKKSPKRKNSPSPSPRRHKKEKKREKERDRDRRSDKERGREERERSSSKKKKSKDKERERDRKSDAEKDVKITRDYDEEEQGYDSEKERGDRKDSDDSALSPRSVEGNGTARSAKQAKVNGADDRHEEDMDVSD